jgi:hypothetical protein
VSVPHGWRITTVWSAHPSRSVLVSRVVCGVGAAQSRAAARTMTLKSNRHVKNAPGPDIGKDRRNPGVG